MTRKEFRHKLLNILNEAGVPQTLSRERFIRLSWHKYQHGGPLFNDTVGKDACRFVFLKLKKNQAYVNYRIFMGDGTYLF